MKNTYDIVADAVRKFWDKNYPQPVLAIFEQRYNHEKDWDKRYEFIFCSSDTDYETVHFLNDFCEGQTEIRDIFIIPMNLVFELAEEYLMEYNELDDFKVVGEE